MFSLFGVSIPAVSKKEILTNIAKKKKPLFVVTVNPEILLLARKDKEYRNIINSADIKVVDGVGIVIMARLLYGVKLTRFPGADLAEALLSKNNKKVFLLGGSKEANKKAIKNLTYDLRPTTYDISGLGGEFSEEQAIQTIQAFKPNIIFVALGAPKQEIFIKNFLQATSYKLQAITIGIGGTVDYWARPSLRAPSIVRHIGLEWLWRLVFQLWRFQRIINAVVVFPFTCLCERILIYLNSGKHRKVR